MEDNEQLILTALQTKFPGVDAKILGRIAKKKAKTAKTEDDVKTIVDGITLQLVIDSYADFRATEARRTAFENYETEHKLKDGKPAQPQTAQQGGAAEVPQPQEQVPAWAQRMMDDNKALRDEWDGALEDLKKPADPKTLEELGEAMGYYERKIQKASETEMAGLIRSKRELEKKRKALESYADTLDKLDEAQRVNALSGREYRVKVNAMGFDTWGSRARATPRLF